MSENEQTALVPQNTVLSLASSVKKHLTTWDDHVNFYVQLEEAQNSVSWVKADLFLNLIEKFGDGSINQFASEINQKASTITNYVRVARGFPPERRNPSVSFSHHFQACLADSYDDTTKEFDGEKRFEWVDKSSEEGWGIRKLQDEIEHEKEKERLGVDIIPCSRCGQSDGEILRCVIYVFGRKQKADRFELHKRCLDEVLECANGKVN